MCLECISRIFGNCRADCNDGGGDICRICCGILQFVYLSGDGNLVRHDCVSDFAVWICELVKKEGHQVEGFSLEVSIPAAVLENENDVWLVHIYLYRCF